MVYEVTKVELLNDETPSSSIGLVGADEGLKPLAKIIENVEKSYAPRKFFE